MAFAVVVTITSTVWADPTKGHHDKQDRGAPTVPTSEPGPSDDTPWGKGVPAERKAAAQRLLSEGNDLFVVNKFREAHAKYAEAVAAWDHPAIRFNMVRTLISLDRPLEASLNLEKALAFGKGPLEEMYTEALNYQRLLAGQIAELELTCKQVGVKVKVDGESLLDCPGTKSTQALPGNHVVVAAKDGFLTHTQDLVLLPGKKQPIVIELITIQRATSYKSRWNTWKPWAVVGGGVALAGLGVLLDVQANNEMAQLERAVKSTCDAGCTAEQYELLGHHSIEARALAENKVAIGLMVAGGVVVIAGAVGVILNRPRPYLTERREPVSPTVQLVPTVSSGGSGLALFGRF